MTADLVRQTASIVHRGHFNPAIFQPAWLAAQNLIRAQEAGSAQIDIIHPKAAIFTAEWLRLNVVEDNFQAGTTQEPYYEALRDLVVGVLSLLSHTPLRALGINREFHFRFPSLDAWHKVGHTLAPKPLWEPHLPKPGMQSLTIRGQRPDDLEGYILVKVEPSTQVEFGVYIEVNDHYQLAPGDEAIPGTSKALDIISRQWGGSMSRASAIAQAIAALGSS